MAIYVDQPDKPFGRMLMCHMIADSTVELLDMALLLGVSRRYIQKHDTRHAHFDICKAKRARAIILGAIELSNRDLAKMTLARKKSQQPTIPQTR